MASRTKVSLSNDHSSIEEIEEFYVDSETALTYYFNPSSFKEIPSHFVGYTKIEFDNELKTRKETLDRMCSLEVLAAIEARFRVDYILRCERKKKDILSRKLREIYQVKANRASLVDDIVATWKQLFPEHKTRLDNLGKALDYRNWLAHGRYWQSVKTPHIYKYDYLALFTLASDILSNMDLYE
jgi:hypothetical protein